MARWRRETKKYLKGVAGGAGIIAVTPSGQAVEVPEQAADSIPSASPQRQGESVFELTVDPIESVNTGIIGIGNRGSNMIELVHALYPQMGEIKALCDIEIDRAEQARDALREEENPQDPDVYGGTEDAWEELVERDDLDLVLTFTDWENHASMAIKAMEEGNHVGIEIPAATTIEDCWKLVDTAERTQSHCMMLENVNYFQEEMWLLNMVKEGVFGDELSYAKGGYIHDLIGDGLFFTEFYWDYWRERAHYQNKGDLYPMHGLGPICHYMDVLRGDNLEFIVSHESPGTRMTQAAAELDPENPWYDVDDWANGDITTSIIETKQGKQITLQHDVKTGRPYNRHDELAGVDAHHEGYPSRLTADGEFTGAEAGDDEYDEYWDEYEHPLWEIAGDLAEYYGGHGGGDFLMLYRLFDALNNGRPTDQNVYEAATWSSVTPLSGLSVEHESVPVKVPDFTRGEWTQDRELQTMDFDTISPPDIE